MPRVKQTPKKCHRHAAFSPHVVTQMIEGVLPDLLKELGVIEKANQNGIEMLKEVRKDGVLLNETLREMRK